MLKSLLVHLTGSPRDDDVLTAAHRMARPFAAHLDCLHIRPALDALVAAAMQTGGDEDGAVISQNVDAMRKIAKENARRAHHSFTEFCKRESIVLAAAPPGPGRVSAAWHEKAGDAVSRLSGEARFRDLAAVAGGGTQGAMSSRALGDIILRSGRPVLLAPAKPSAEPLRTVAIAWKDTPEAARAVAVAMPLLAKAERIVLLAANEENATAKACVDCADSVAGHFRWHGLHAETRYVIPAGRSLPDAVLETARETGADLLVMGAYGRSRFSETLFGGFTQRILAGADLPIFIFH